VAVSSVPLIDRAQAAAYAAALSAELAALVRRHHLHTLGYLLDMARLEAEEIVQQTDDASAMSDSKGSRSSDQRK
jgi:hypothetical protein